MRHLILSLSFFVGSFVYADQADINKKIALEEFRSQVHPVLMNRCTECHGEFAEDPAGPKHSHSNAELAFPEFWRRMNVEQLEMSSFWRTGSNRHFCDKFNYNCDIDNQVVSELQTALTNFSKAVKENSEYASLEEETDQVVQLGPSEVKTLEFEIAKDARAHPINLEVELGRIKDSNFYFVERISMVAQAGIYRLQGVHLLVDGVAPVKRTGYESLERFLIFSDPLLKTLGDYEFKITNFMSQPILKKPLAPYRPIIEIIPGAKLTVQVDSLIELWRYPEGLCDLIELDDYNDYVHKIDHEARMIVRDQALGSSVLSMDFEANSENQMYLKLCRVFDAEVNYYSPRRSSAMAAVASEDQNAGRMDAITSIWEQWRTQGQPERKWQPYVLADLLNEDSLMQIPIFRGEHLYNVAGCVNCHGSDLTGGTPIKSPFGTFYAPNISVTASDASIQASRFRRWSNDGPANWSFEDFKQAMREGINPKTSKPYYPAFPYSSYGAMTDEDLAALWAYISTVPSNPAVPNKHHNVFGASGLLSVVSNFGLKQWKKGSLSPVELRASKIDSSPFPEGAYLANAVMHCGECHTSRNRFYMTEEDKWFQGGLQLENSDGSKSTVPSIAKGSNMSGWSRNELENYLRTGQASDGSMADGKMREVIENQSSQLSDVEMNHLLDYLMDQSN
ncbi:MAG: cytochrome c [Bdellovibrionales bacterium]